MWWKARRSDYHCAATSVLPLPVSPASLCLPLRPPPSIPAHPTSLPASQLHPRTIRRILPTSTPTPSPPHPSLLHLPHIRLALLVSTRSSASPHTRVDANLRSISVQSPTRRPPDHQVAVRAFVSGPALCFRSWSPSSAFCRMRSKWSNTSRRCPF